MDNTSLNHSDIFILMIGTYLSLHQVPGSIDNTTFFNPMPRRDTRSANY